MDPQRLAELQERQGNSGHEEGGTRKVPHPWSGEECVVLLHMVLLII